MDFLKDFPREPLLQSLDFARACRGRDIRWRGRFLVEQAVYRMYEKLKGYKKKQELY